MNLTEFLKKNPPPIIAETQQIIPATQKAPASEKIYQGRRNSEMYGIAVRLQIRYGICEESWNKFIKESDRCEPLLSRKELNDIWLSAKKYSTEVQSRPGYISPDIFNAPPKYKPKLETHVDEAEVLAKVFGDQMKYCESTGFLIYNGTHWEPDQIGARRNMQLLSELQIEEGMRLFGPRDPYTAFAMSMRFSTNISSILREVVTMIKIKPEDLDKNGYLLCTPSGTIDLNYGIESLRPNDPKDFITKCTSVSAGDEGAEIWAEFLEKICCNDKELEEYLQKLCGVAAVGKIELEALIICFGSGRNGKSSFWNCIRNVMGSYADSMASDVLMRDTRRNIYPELAELQGKRLIIAAETAENARLNEVLVKQMCSSDFIRAEKKYQSPFSFRPSHSIVLSTNFLPKVGSALDSGIWRRLKPVPFSAIIDSSEDVKNYAEILTDSCGPAILSWIIQGARMAIADNFNIQEPKCVLQAIEEYKSDSDWFNQFVVERCEIGDDYQESSSKLYQSYRVWSEEMGERSHSTKDFYKQLENADFHRITSKNQRVINGIRLKSDISGQ